MCINKFNISNEDIKSILDYVNDDTKQVPMPSYDTVGNFQALYFSLQRRLAKDYEEMQKRCFKAERRLERIDKHQDRQTAEGIFAESGLDSLEVADVLLYYLQQLKTYKFTKGKFMSILFHMYASWLGSKKERLFAEQPVATEWGPQFWRVYKRLDLQRSIPYDVVVALQEKRSDIAVYVRNAANKYYDIREKELSDIHLKCTPYKNALPHTNEGKWNKQISDSDIFLWKNNPQKQ